MYQSLDEQERAYVQMHTRICTQTTYQAAFVAILCPFRHGALHTEKHEEGLRASNP